MSDLHLTLIVHEIRARRISIMPKYVIVYQVRDAAGNSGPVLELSTAHHEPESETDAIQWIVDWLFEFSGADIRVERLEAQS